MPGLGEFLPQMQQQSNAQARSKAPKQKQQANVMEDVRVLLRRPLFATFLGYTPGVRGGAGNLKPAAPLVRASTSDEALFELLLDLKRLDDYCLSNRVIIFNDEDLQQVRSLMAAPSQRPENRIDAEEVRGFLEDARQHLKEAAAALKE